MKALLKKYKANTYGPGRMIPNWTKTLPTILKNVEQVYSYCGKRPLIL